MKKNKSNTATVSSSKFRVNSFFAGIGGFELAFEQNDFVTAFYCESETFCRSVLKRHWPEVPNSVDIENTKLADVPPADVWTAGFPCQDLSLARTPHGARKGLNGTRSGLFYSFLGLLSTRKPPVVLLENVAGLLNSHGGADFGALVRSLTDLGYAVAWRVVNARYFGVPQSRPRIFICAWLNSPSRAVEALYEEQIAPHPKNERQGFLHESKCSKTGAFVSQISFCISATSGRHTGLDWARSYVSYSNAVRRLTPLECERLQGLPDGWTFPDRSYVIPIRGIETNRYHAIGNAVCVPVVGWIATRIRKGLKRNGKKEGRGSEEPLRLLARAHISAKPDVLPLPDEGAKVRWKTGGVAYKNWIATAAASSRPVNPVDSKLIDVIEKVRVNDRYFISSNAAQGILRRVSKLRRKLFPPMQRALEKVINAHNKVSEEESKTILRTDSKRQAFR